MAVISLHFFNSRHFCYSSARSYPPPNLSNSNSNGNATVKSVRGRRGRRSSSSRSSFAVLSTHSNPKIFKSNRKSPYGRTISTFDDSDEDEEDDFSDDDEEEQEDDDEDEEDNLSDDDSEDEESDDDLQSSYLDKNTKFKQGKGIQPKRVWEETSSVYGESMEMAVSRVGVKLGRTTPDKRRFGDSFHSSNKVQGIDPVDAKKRGKMKTEKSTESRFRQLLEELDLDEKWLPLLDYLSTFDLKESHFIQMYERHMPSLQINVASAQEKLEFLVSVGVKHKDIKKILMRQPQILGYSVENNIKAHIAFLVDLGVPQSRLGHIITSAPSLFSYSVEQSLKPTVRYLVEEVGIKSSDLSKVVQLSPQILVQRIDNSWNTRFNFLSKELGAPKDSIVKMVKKHPQLLHYSIEDGILPRINFLRSIGMRNSEIVKVLTSLTQVLSLSLEGNLKPKYLYLVNELGNEVKSLTKYPTYLSLSLDQRIRPRHKFLVYLKKAPKGPFPLSSFVPTDESFCQQWAGTSVEKYLAFRQNLLLKQLANKYERKR